MGRSADGRVKKDEKGNIIAPYRQDDFEFGEFGFPDDGYDYSQHFRASAGGYFISTVDNVTQDKDVEMDELRKKMEQEKNEMDPEILKALMEETDQVIDQFGELNDDFLTDAGGLTPHFLVREDPFFDPRANDDSVPHLLPIYAQKQEELRQMRQQKFEESKFEAPPTSDYISKNDPTFLNERFSIVAQEYDEDAIGGLDDEAEEIGGTEDIEHFDSVLDEFLKELHRNKNKAAKLKRAIQNPEQGMEAESEDEEEEEYIFEEGDNAEKKVYTRMANKLNKRQFFGREGEIVTMKEWTEGMEVEKTIALAKRLEAESNEIGSDDDENLKDPALYEIVDARNKREEWDCETITTTFTNTENHPRLIIDRDYEARRIQLHKKTGMPLASIPKKPVAPTLKDTAESDSDESDLASMYSQLSIRTKDETPEEKKNRKNAIRQIRKDARLKKKELKLRYNQEALRQATENSRPLQKSSVLTF
eukprot:TRINITY_DN3468_c0_g1_i3.p1 TRINITY_DN3468_c0_g1~~TRINITY_DN3468_c0_g1_i3.p1  ORF type:complete len:477 (-),score=245.65 TRINITY_DN3468_c0_g1_i3:107-1537(-)